MGDLGLLYHLPHGRSTTKLAKRGNAMYAAPEIVPKPAAVVPPGPAQAGGSRGQPPVVSSHTSTSSASDVYSFGLSIAEVICGRGKLKHLVQFSYKLHVSIAGALSWVAACAGAHCGGA
ncbi:hypothetical protein FOA52_008697 [Chlamydomonas sp. UWO 241]|nr:hypothetical protein FOA52_008697 [Chlamydomonas sp. UWO 241]